MISIINQSSFFFLAHVHSNLPSVNPLKNHYVVDRFCFSMFMYNKETSVELRQ
jgi:hypothetical protein